jgi:hypothetical protein
MATAIAASTMRSLKHRGRRMSNRPVYAAQPKPQTQLLLRQLALK